MKTVIAILISALGMTLLAWLYQLMVPEEDPNTYQKIILTAENEISEDLHLELTQRYGDQFSSVILSKPIEKGSSASYLALLIFILPISAVSVLLYLGTLRILRKADPGGGINSESLRSSP
jgi:hypothetical protein